MLFIWFIIVAQRAATQKILSTADLINLILFLLNQPLAQLSLLVPIARYAFFCLYHPSQTNQLEANWSSCAKVQYQSALLQSSTRVHCYKAVEDYFSTEVECIGELQFEEVICPSFIGHGFTAASIAPRTNSKYPAHSCVVGCKKRRKGVGANLRWQP